jgi:hypothetical protein
VRLYTLCRVEREAGYRSTERLSLQTILFPSPPIGGCLAPARLVPDSEQLEGSMAAFRDTCRGFPSRRWVVKGANPRFTGARPAAASPPSPALDLKRAGSSPARPVGRVSWGRFRLVLVARASERAGDLAI